MIRLEQLRQIRLTLQKKYSQALISPMVKKEEISDPFIQKIEAYILQNIADEFSIDDLAQAVFLSRSQLHRKIKAMTGKTPALFIRWIRLRLANKLLMEGNLNISEIAFKVGFKTPIYFSQVYKNTFGESPTKARKKL